MVSCADREHERRPSRYLIPDGYVGWVKIYFEVSDAPTLPIEDEHYLFVFPPTGIIKTSSKEEFGVSSYDDYYYFVGNKRQPLKQTVWGAGGMIWGGHTGSDFQGFFVGTESQYRMYAAYQDKPGRVN